MSEETSTTWLAGFLNKQREIIEAAETPFAKLAVFILPILAPVIPATFTGLHLYKLLLEVFTFLYGKEISAGLALTASIVLEMLGYVGAISFIQSIFRWIRTKQDEYLLPAGLNGVAYLFYLILMFAVNVKLGQYFGTPAIINTIIGLLSFITVPTSLLAANHLGQKEEREEEHELRQENRADRLERYRIKHGKIQESSIQLSKDVESFQKVSKKNRNFPESFYELSSWRKIREQLSREEMESLANMTPTIMQECANELGKDYRTISNWRMDARRIMEQDNNE